MGVKEKPVQKPKKEPKVEEKVEEKKEEKNTHIPLNQRVRNFPFDTLNMFMVCTFFL